MTDCNGCANGGSDGGVDCHDLGIDIYACRGTFSNGMEDTSTTSICNTNKGYHICYDATEAASFGLTASLCSSLPSDELYFTQETGVGGATCYTELGGRTDGLRDDVWACGGSSLCCSTGICPCNNILTTACGNGYTGAGFDLGPDADYEYDYVEITNRSVGGVLCCHSGTSIPTSLPTSKPTVPPTSLV